MAKHSEILFVFQRSEYFLKQLFGEGFNSLFGADGLAITWTVNGYDIELLKIGYPDEILMKQVSILIGRVPGSRAMND